MKGNSRIEEFLIKIAPMGKFVQWLLAEGQLYIPVCETKTYKPFSDFIKITKPSRCFENSMAAFDAYGLDYTEGFYYFKDKALIPLQHAWNLSEDGVLYDFTCKKQKYTPCEWFGVKVPKDITKMALIYEISPLNLHYILNFNGSTSDIEKFMAIMKQARQFRNEIVSATTTLNY